LAWHGELGRRGATGAVADRPGALTGHLLAVGEEVPVRIVARKASTTSRWVSNSGAFEHGRR